MRYTIEQLERHSRTMTEVRNEMVECTHEQALETWENYVGIDVFYMGIYGNWIQIDGYDDFQDTGVEGQYAIK